MMTPLYDRQGLVRGTQRDGYRPECLPDRRGLEVACIDEAAAISGSPDFSPDAGHGTLILLAKEALPIKLPC